MTNHNNEYLTYFENNTWVGWEEKMQWCAAQHGSELTLAILYLTPFGLN